MYFIYIFLSLSIYLFIHLFNYIFLLFIFSCFFFLFGICLFFFIKITNWLSSCFAIAIRADFRQSFGGSMSITAQCIEPQLMPNEGSGKDLQIMCWSLLRQISPSWRNLRHKV